MNVEERLTKIESDIQDLREGLEVMSNLLSNSEKQKQRHIIELTDHFAASLEPKVKKVIYSYIDVIRENDRKEK